MIDVHSKVTFWVEKNTQLEKNLYYLYQNPKTKHLIFNTENINKIRNLVDDYNYIQSLQVIKFLPKIKTRINQSNLPNEIEKIQCIFLESFPVAILAVLEISMSSEASTPGVDNKFFPTLSNKKLDYINHQIKGTRYQKSGKSFKIKKDLPQNAIITDKIAKQLKLELLKETTEFRFKLLQQCNLKTIQKNYKKYKGSSINRIWIPIRDTGKYQSLDIPTIRDRTLQQIISWSILPISESQADALSFSRPQRSAIQAIKYIYKKLAIKKKKTRKCKVIPKQVGKEIFHAFSGKKAKFRSFKIFIKANKKNKRQIIYNYNYWIYPLASITRKPSTELLFQSQYYFLNICIEKCFNRISHQSIYEKIPLTNKYFFFITRWVSNTIIGPEVKGGQKVRIKPTCGVPQNSFLGERN